MKSKRKPKVVLGDLNSLEACSAELLEKIFQMSYNVLIPKWLVSQLNEDRRQVIEQAQKLGQVQLLSLSPREKLKAMTAGNKHVSFNDVCAAHLARREKASLILYDSFWQQADVAFDHVEMPPHQWLKVPLPLLLMLRHHGQMYLKKQSHKNNTNKAG